MKKHGLVVCRAASARYCVYWVGTMGEPSRLSLNMTMESTSGSSTSTCSAWGMLTSNLPSPQASRGLPSPVIEPMTRLASWRPASDRGSRDRPAVPARSRTSSAWPPEAVSTPSFRPVGQRSP